MCDVVMSLYWRVGRQPGPSESLFFSYFSLYPPPNSLKLCGNRAVLEELFKNKQNTSTVDMSSRKCSGDGTPDRRYIKLLEIRYTIAPSGDLPP